jgi:hypothetical protein
MLTNKNVNEVTLISMYLWSKSMPWTSIILKPWSDDKLFRICLGLLHFTNFSSASQITYQTPLTSPTQFQKKSEVGPNFNIFMKQQNRCFTNRYFELPHEVESKLPTITTGYIKMIRSICSPPRSTVTRASTPHRCLQPLWGRAS